jgi:hypothetical protein
MASVRSQIMFPIGFDYLSRVAIVNTMAHCLRPEAHSATCVTSFIVCSSGGSQKSSKHLTSDMELTFHEGVIAHIAI